VCGMSDTVTAGVTQSAYLIECSRDVNRDSKVVLRDSKVARERGYNPTGNRGGRDECAMGHLWPVTVHAIGE
jgi:hypothetical protein